MEIVLIVLNYQFAHLLKNWYYRQFAFFVHMHILVIIRDILEMIIIVNEFFLQMANMSNLRFC